MALFGQQPRKDEPLSKPEPRVEPPPTPAAASHPAPHPAPPATRSGDHATRRGGADVDDHAQGSESILSAGLTIEGKIEGNGNIRVAGRFKGNVNVKGELTIEPGAAIDVVKADTVWSGARSAGT